LAQVLRRLPTPNHPDLLVGTSSGDDAAVWRVSPDRAIVATVDFFTPVVDDPATWGAIAAANSASDVYAMGGKPLFALNVAAWPRELLSLDLLGDVLAGAGAVAERGGWMVIGGHTVDGPEPLYGMSMVGDVHPDRILTNDAAQIGDTIVLTKPLGTGLVTTALKHSPAAAIADGGALAESYREAVRWMTTLNDTASAIAQRADLRCATDITGFGLIGHLHKLAAGSGVAVELSIGEVPLLSGVQELIHQGFVPGGTERNCEFVAPAVMSKALWAQHCLLLADPQTSGGLALCVPSDRVDDVCGELRRHGLLAARIGTIRPAETQHDGAVFLV
jgi:selenide, water dikinase